MGKTTEISWTDHTFNPWWGCQRVSPGCENSAFGVQVMAVDVFARSALPVELREHLSATAGAVRHRVRFSGVPKLVHTVFALPAAVLRAVLPTGDDLQILRAIVRLIIIQVVHQFAPVKWTPKHFRCNKPMFVHVAPYVCQRVTVHAE